MYFYTPRINNWKMKFKNNIFYGSIKKYEQFRDKFNKICERLLY